MNRIDLWRVIVAGAMSFLLASGGTAFAQPQTGDLIGFVTDDKDPKPAPLPGVTITVTGQGDPQVQVTDAKGRYRFLGLPPGNYSLRAELAGFTPVDYPTVVIIAGYETDIEVALSPVVSQRPK